MRLFTRKSKWERLVDSATATLTSTEARRLGKVALGVVGAVVTATAASAAISSVRQPDET